MPNKQVRLNEEECDVIKQFREGQDMDSSAAVLRTQVSSLRSQVSELTATGASVEILTSLFNKVMGKHDSLPKDISWLDNGKPSSGFFSGIPSLLISDLHFGEVVRPEEVNHANMYNTEIAKKRLARVINTTIELLSQFKEAKYDGFVLVLAGDLMSGILHDLPESNDETATQSVLTTVNCLITAIDKLRDKYVRVFIPCVVGNHDRITYRRTKTKGAVHDSFAWLVYKMLERHFAGDTNVVFEIAGGHALCYKVNGRTYLLSHGDDIKGGNSAISGVLTAFTLAAMRKIKQWAGTGVRVDTCLWGHFHTLSWGHRYSYISNGSLIGVGQYSLKYNMGYEPPQQALWITAPNKEIVAAFAVRGEETAADDITPDWVSVQA